MTDLLVKLYGFDLAQRAYDAEKSLIAKGIEIKRASIIDKTEILEFVAREFPNESAWQNECEYALFNNPTSCHIAVQNRKVIGFACYDATAKGFFGPTGVAAGQQGNGIGAALLLKSLNSMKEAGYAYAIIGWVAEVKGFYEKVADAIEIPDSPPKNSAYRNLISQ